MAMVILLSSPCWKTTGIVPLMPLSAKSRPSLESANVFFFVHLGTYPPFLVLAVVVVGDSDSVVLMKRGEVEAEVEVVKDTTTPED